MNHRLRTLAGGLVWLAATGAIAADYPDRAVTLVVPNPPGGAADVVARAVAQKMDESLGKPVVVENAAGASGNIGAAQVARAEPDGYTIGLGVISTHALNKFLVPNTPFDPQTDFTPLCLISSVVTVLAVDKNVEATSIDDLARQAKATPGSLKYGSLGPGTTLDLAARIFSLKTGAELQHIPYKGQGELMTDLLAGRINIVFNNFSAVKGGVESGDVKLLAISSKNPAMPEVPTFEDAGYPELSVTPWLGFFGPAGMSAPVVEKLEQACIAAVKDEGTASTLVTSGNAVLAGGAQALKDYQAAEIDRWGKLLAEMGLTRN